MHFEPKPSVESFSVESPLFADLARGQLTAACQAVNGGRMESQVVRGFLYGHQHCQHSLSLLIELQRRCAELVVTERWYAPLASFGCALMSSVTIVRTRAATLGLDRAQLKAKLLAISGDARVLPWGHFAETARALGVSEPTLRLLMAEASVSMARPGGPRECADCGRDIKPRNQTGLCRSCLINSAKITLTCVNCGNTFQRRKGDHRAFARRILVQPRRRGPVCSKSCRARVVQRCTWCGRRLSPRWRSHATRYPFCGAPDNCHWKAIRVLPVRYWSCFDPKLVPMKRHQNAIALMVARAKALRAESRSSP